MEKTHCRHAPRERVSWNVWAVNQLSYNGVTLHVSVWVEIQPQSVKNTRSGSRSTWACELKYYESIEFPFAPMSRSTWACELKCNRLLSSLWQNRHAPRERVSWNPQHLHPSGQPTVTLHVSVWVEIFWAFVNPKMGTVTLHVSVWVEMPWLQAPERLFGVTLHVSVWVEIYNLCVKVRNNIVTLHVSVWVEIADRGKITPEQYVTLHVSVWVEIISSFVCLTNLLVTLHVSVWVEIKQPHTT